MLRANRMKNAVLVTVLLLCYDMTAVVIDALPRQCTWNGDTMRPETALTLASALTPSTSRTALRLKGGDDERRVR